MVTENTSRTVAFLSSYDGLLRRDYGIAVRDVREETIDGWEHLVASAERELPPEEAVRRLSNVLGLVPAGSLFARTLEEAELYNRYRLAIRAHGEEMGLGLDSAGQSPMEPIEGVPMVWGVLPVRDETGHIVRCRFCLQEPTLGETHAGIDVEEVRSAAREAVLQRRMDAGLLSSAPR